MIVCMRIQTKFFKVTLNRCLRCDNVGSFLSKHYDTSTIIINFVHIRKTNKNIITNL